jgi:hypothetical protein
MKSVILLYQNVGIVTFQNFPAITISRKRGFLEETTVVGEKEKGQ